MSIVPVILIAYHEEGEVHEGLIKIISRKGAKMRSQKLIGLSHLFINHEGQEVHEALID